MSVRSRLEPVPQPWKKWIARAYGMPLFILAAPLEVGYQAALALRHTGEAMAEIWCDCADW